MPVYGMVTVDRGPGPMSIEAVQLEVNARIKRRKKEEVGGCSGHDRGDSEHL